MKHDDTLSRKRKTNVGMEAVMLFRRRWLPIVVLLLFCVGLFFYGLGTGEFYRNETLRALIAQNMLQSGDWIVPTLYGEPLFTKPPGMYLAIVLASLPFGAVTEWSARLPSALAASALVFLFYWYCARHFGRRAGLIAALILPMSPLWLERATSAEIDVVQTAWVAASILFFLRAIEPAAFVVQVANLPNWPHDRLATCSTIAVRFPWILAALLCVAGGTLTKWTAPAFFYLTVIPFLWWNGQLRLLLGWRHLVSAGLAAAIVVGWIGAAVAQTSWNLFYDTVSREALQHLAPGHGRKPFFCVDILLHPFLVLAATLPWSAAALLALRPGFVKLWDERGRFFLQAFYCWIGPNLLLWSLASEHSVRHCAPLFPAVAGLAAMVCLAWTEGKLPWRLPRLRPARAFALLLTIWFVCKVLFVEVVIPQRTAKRHTRDKAVALAGLVPIGKILYLFRLKDQGIMFYFGRPALRLAGPEELPFTNEPLYCILTETEWRGWTGPTAEVVGWLQDAQGDGIVLVRIRG